MLPVEKDGIIDFDFYWDVVVSNKIVPWERCYNMTQDLDLSVLHFRPIVEFDRAIKIRYKNRQWVL